MFLTGGRQKGDSGNMGGGFNIKLTGVSCLKSSRVVMVVQSGTGDVSYEAASRMFVW